MAEILLEPLAQQVEPRVGCAWSMLVQFSPGKSDAGGGPQL
jgi:hypothetical protein